MAVVMAVVMVVVTDGDDNVDNDGNPLFGSWTEGTHVSLWYCWVIFTCSRINMFSNSPLGKEIHYSFS